MPAGPFIRESARNGFDGKREQRTNRKHAHSHSSVSSGYHINNGAATHDRGHRCSPEAILKKRKLDSFGADSPGYHEAKEDKVARVVDYRSAVAF